MFYHLKKLGVSPSNFTNVCESSFEYLNVLADVSITCEKLTELTSEAFIITYFLFSYAIVILI